MSYSESSEERFPLLAEGGIERQTNADADPFETLDDLMVVIEGLCPTWPRRPCFTGTEDFRL